MNIKTKKIIVVSFIILFLLLGIGITYAFFTAVVANGDKGSSVIVKTGNLALKYDEDIVSGEIKIPGDSLTKVFTVENIGDVTTDYLVYFSKVINEFDDPTELVYNVSCTSYKTGTNIVDGTCDGKSESIVPIESELMLTGSNISPGITHEYILTIIFKEQNSEQNYNQDKTFSTSITINELIDSINLVGYVIDNEGNPLVNKTIIIHSDIASTVTNDDGYFSLTDIRMGDHTLIVKDGNSVMAQKGIVFKKTGTKRINGNIVEYDTLMAVYPLEISVVNDELLLAYRKTGSPLRTLIMQTYGPEETIKNKVSPNYEDEPSTDEGLFAMKDENSSYSYYFRGDVQNNYVSFADKIWRIVRINGDGSIRMILYGNALDSSMTEYAVSYNSSSDCNGDISISRAAECVKYGHGDYASTSVKGIVEEWYNRVIASTPYANYVVNQNFCNDYSYTDAGTGNISVFGAWNRLYQHHTPSIACNKTFASGSTELLNLKVGLLTADELVMAGGVWSGRSASNYLYYSKPFAFTMSGAVFIPDNGNYIFTFGEVRFNDGLISSNNQRIRPVINLKNNVTANGDGSVNLPYTIEI